MIADDEPDADLALLLARLGSAHWFAGNLERAAEWTERGLDIAEALQLPEVLVRGWTVKAMAIAPTPARGGSRPVPARRSRLALAHELWHGGNQLPAPTSPTSASSATGTRESLGYPRAGARRSHAGSATAGTEWFALSEMTLRADHARPLGGGARPGGRAP